MAMGLAASTLVSSSDKAVALVPILLIPQVIFSNFVVPLGDVQKIFARIMILAYSAFEAMRNLFSNEAKSFAQAEGGFAHHIMPILLMTLGFVVLAVAGLKWKDMEHR